MTIREKIIQEVKKQMDRDDKTEPSRDWRMERASFYLRQLEQEEIEKAIKSNGQH